MKRCWCGNKELKLYSDEYYRCEKCKTLISAYDLENSIYNTENEEHDLYGKNYWEVSMTKAAGKSTLSEVVDMYLTERVIYWLKYVLRYMKLGSEIAEIGCGLGQLQYVLKNLGYKQLAFELSKEICNYMEDNLGVDTHCGPFEENTRQYDGILAFDLFEHLLQPEEFMDKCNDSLREGGVLCMQTPCYAPEWTYEEMLQKGKKFQEQLKAEQHVYIYSKESITHLLTEKGYSYIRFEPAFFGDDYDMFLFASKSPLSENSGEEIEQYLNSVPSGRLVKAMISLFDEKNRKTKECEAIDNERKKILKDVETLTRLVDEKEKQTDKFRDAAEERLASMERMAAENKMLQQAADERLSDVERLLAENKVLQQAADERLSDVERLLAENKILQQAADERLAIIEKMTHAEETK